MYWTGPDAEEWAQAHALRMEAYHIRDTGQETEATIMLMDAEERRRVLNRHRSADLLAWQGSEEWPVVEAKVGMHPLAPESLRDAVRPGKLEV